ncbi:MAG: glycosyltransferase family 2 protein [Culturomica sp.]|jgi:glycosyltransferase involved in cell wall biosynthesis|nr:glycosyltransferase family 2 protein [Culturomica sp.]
MNKTSGYDFCIIVPVYNEIDNLLRVETELEEYRESADIKTCILLVDDGSNDGSLDLIKEICGRREHFFYIACEKNGGLSAAMKAGIDVAESEYVGYIDADLQTTPKDFERLLQHIKDYEMVIGIRVGRKDSFVKNLSSRIANGFRRMMTHDGIEDTGCPLKVIRTSYAKRIPFFTGMHRFLPALVQLQNGKVYQLPVRHFERIAGKSKYHLWNRLIGPFKDCFAYRWMRKRWINYSIVSEDI